MTRTFAFVFARGGSKGLPDKNILPIGGIPMLAHGIQLALSINEIENIFVSTESPKIASISKEYGATVINRPHELASDTTPEWLAWQHAIDFVQRKFGRFDRFLSLPATAPLRNTEDVQKCLNALQEGVDVVITMASSYRNPWFNMVTADMDGTVKLIAGDGYIKRRQDTRECFDVTTLAYVSRPDFILRKSSIWDGNVVGIEVPKERSIDIDDSFDFSIARFLMERSQQE